MSRNGQQDAGVWNCTCGRQVPARFDECHCGVTRVQALAIAKADAPPPRKPLTLLGLALRLGALAAAGVVSVAVFIVYFPSQPPPVGAPPSVSPTAHAAPTPVPSVSVAPTPWVFDTPTLEVPPAASDETEPHAAASEKPTEADLIEAHLEQWRARYRSQAERVAELQKEVALLEAGTIPYDARDPGRNEDIRRLNELRRQRLDAARASLEQAEKALKEIEEAAEREGILPGQLR